MPASIFQVKRPSLTGQSRRDVLRRLCQDSLVVRFADGQRRESEVHEKQGRLQQRLLQLHPLPGFSQRSQCLMRKTPQLQIVKKT